jgi:hypothetical protein
MRKGIISCVYLWIKLPFSVYNWKEHKLMCHTKKLIFECIYASNVTLQKYIIKWMIICKLKMKIHLIEVYNNDI